tara:strand:+ start:1102 stop:1341 length:240 start_codon:yes stop_codon:yes gene_type:complete
MDDIIIEIENWIFENFNVRVKSNQRYIDLGVIDSLDIIILIDFIERKYNLKFSSDDFQDSRFFTVEGLASLIVEKNADV